jgi:hypothetical protein
VVKNIIIMVLAVILAVFGVTFYMPFGKNTQTCKPEEHGHKAYHGGSLNVISECTTGHLEIKVIEDKIDAWLVSGNQDTNKSVRIKADTIALSVFLPDGTDKELALTASPLELAGEKAGDCSHFEARAAWLNGIRNFKATGKIFFKEKWLPLIIVYPEGFNPDHD